MDANPPRPASAVRRPPHATLVHVGPQFRVWQWDGVTPNGDTKTYEQVERADTSIILPLTDDGQILLARERKPFASLRVHALGGQLAFDESPLQGARRELREEAGVEAAAFGLWTAWQPSDNLDWAVYIYFAIGLRFCSELRSLDDDEQISVIRWPFARLLDGSICRELEDPELVSQITLALTLPEKMKPLISVLSGLASERQAPAFLSAAVQTWAK